ncbi:MAG: aminoacyl-tRNA hydrolase [Candidatus Paceibacterota bacterium]|jgi:PTH1 family peptidyl-tRNA hydrolase
MFYIVGLGNPGEEYINTRHNTGRMAILKLAKDLEAPEFVFNKKANALISETKIGKEKLTLILPETFMNKSGNAVSYFVKPLVKVKAASAKATSSQRKGLENLIVVHDDLDLPLETLKISYNKGVGGHRGLDSVRKAVKTLEFVRVRIGISPATSKGRAKKPEGEQKVLDFILGKFKPTETDTMKKIFKKSSEAMQSIIADGRDRAMNVYNS